MENERKIIDLIRSSSDPGEAVKVAFWLLTTLLAEQGTCPEPLAVATGTAE